MKQYIIDIREENFSKEWVNRDEIIDKMLNNDSVLFSLNVTENNEWLVGNIVDWFSAHYTRGSVFMKEYISEFARKKVKIRNAKGRYRNIWAYKIASTKIPEEVDDVDSKLYKEGKLVKVLVNKYERNFSARNECISYHGLNCKVCDMNFKNVYGELGNGFIHIHHLKKISKIGQEYELDPIKDLIPVCPNCHSMLHKKEPHMDIEELRELVKKTK